MPLQVRRFSAYALILSEDHVLLSKLNQGPNAGKWNLIGGEINHGENPLATIKRECKEEAKITITKEPNLLTVLSGQFIYKNQQKQEEDLHLIGIIYLIHLPKKLKCKTDGDGESSDGCKWFPINSLPQEKVVSFAIESLALI